MNYTEQDSTFLKPTLVGVAVGTGSVALLTMLLLLLALVVRSGGRTEGDEGVGAGQGIGDAAGAFDTDGDGSGTQPTEEVISGNQGQTAGKATNNQPRQARDRPSEESTTRPTTARTEQKEGLSHFTIAALPEASEAAGTESSGSGSGFSDVGDRLDRAGAKTGDVQVSLAWNNVNDLDLHIIAPSGERIVFNHKRSACRGELDVDMNASGNRSQKPVENIYWPAGQAPKGTYRVQICHYANQGGRDPTKYQVRVLVDGRTRQFSGHIRFNGQQLTDVHHFTRR